MVIRAWVEDGSSKPLRAQVRHTSDVSTGFKVEATHTEADSVLEEVRTFLTTLGKTES
jgi:hypothetical protein